METVITTRAAKGAPLTYLELDENFENLRDTADAASDAVIALGGKANASALGVSTSATNMGTFTDAIIPDNQTAKQALQALETATGDINENSDATKGAAKVGYKADLASSIGRTQADKNLEAVSIKDFGAVDDYDEFVDGSITSGTSAFTSATAGFTPASVGKSIVVAGAGAAGAGLVTTISAYVSATAVTLSANASTTVLGAKFGFGTDNYAAWVAAIAVADEILIPRGSYYFGTGLTAAGGKSIYSRSGLLSGPAKGTRLFFPPTAATFLSLGGPSDALGNGLSTTAENFSVECAADIASTGTVGVNVERLYMPMLRRIKSKGAAKGFRFKHDGLSRGLGATMDNCNTAYCTDVDIEVDSWAELRASLCRFGQNGTEVNSAAYIRIKGGSTTNAAAGPNTVHFTNCQFNRGSGGHVTSVVEFVDKLAASISDSREFRFTSCHIEGFDNVVKSDASWTTIDCLTFSNTRFNSEVEFFNLNAATLLSNFKIDSTSIVSGDMTLNQSQPYYALDVRCRVSGNLSLTSGNSASSAIVDAAVIGNMTLAGAWGKLKVGGNVSGTLTNNATGTWSVCLAGVDQKTWTPGISFGGGTTGITYTKQAGVISKIGEEVFAQFEITLSAKGSSTGNVFLTGLPIAPRGGVNGNSSNGGGGTINYATAMAGLTGAIAARFPSGATVDLYQWGATGMARVTDANFTNTTTIAGTIRYRGA